MDALNRHNGIGRTSAWGAKLEVSGNHERTDSALDQRGRTYDLSGRVRVVHACPVYALGPDVGEPGRRVRRRVRRRLRLLRLRVRHDGSLGERTARAKPPPRPAERGGPGGQRV